MYIKSTTRQKHVFCHGFFQNLDLLTRILLTYCFPGTDSSKILFLYYILFFILYIIFYILYIPYWWARYWWPISTKSSDYLSLHWLLWWGNLVCGTDVFVSAWERERCVSGRQEIYISKLFCGLHATCRMNMNFQQHRNGHVLTTLCFWSNYFQC